MAALAGETRHMRTNQGMERHYMRIRLSTTFTVILVMNAGAALAQCDFDIAPAKALRTSMVRTFAACPSTEHPTGNVETDAGTAACTPVKVREFRGDKTAYNYGENGYCTVQSSAKIASDCSKLEDSNGNPLQLPEGPCHIAYVKSKCSGILDQGSLSNSDIGTPINGSDDGWSLAVLTRATFDDHASGDMTVIDFPVSFYYSTPENGKMAISSTSAEVLVPLVGVNAAALPTCTSIELVEMTIKDPDGNPFARPGGATRP